MVGIHVLQGYPLYAMLSGDIDLWHLHVSWRNGVVNIGRQPLKQAWPSPHGSVLINMPIYRM